MRADHIAGMSAIFVPLTIPQPAGSDKWRHTRSASCRGCVTHFMGQVGWSGFAGGLRSATAHGAVLPHCLRGRFRQATRCALEARHQAVRSQDRTLETCAWKLFCLIPFLLLWRPFGGRRVSREDLCERFDKFTQVSGTHCSKKRWWKTVASPRQERPLWKLGPGQHAKRCSWVRSPSIFGWRQHRARHRGE